MYQPNKFLHESLLNSSSSMIEKFHLEMTIPSMNISKTLIKPENDYTNISINRYRNLSNKPTPKISINDKSELKKKYISIMSNTSFAFSFDANLKHQMEHFKYNQMNEIVEEEVLPSKNIYNESLDDRLYYKEVPRFDITNKLLNLIILDLAYKRILIFFFILSILIRIFLYFYFHYSLYGDLEFNFIYLILLYGPRLFYMFSMIKILFQPKTEDFFFERICEGFNYFDNAPQNIWKQQMHYDYSLKLGGYSTKNITKFYKNKTEIFFNTMVKAVKPIFDRILLIILPVELNFLAFFYVFRKKERIDKEKGEKDGTQKGLIKKLILISAWIYQSYEVWFMAPCLVLMTLNEEIRGKALNIDVTLDTIAFLILIFNVGFFLSLMIFICFTTNENAVKGPNRFF